MHHYPSQVDEQEIERRRQCAAEARRALEAQSNGNETQSQDSERQVCFNGSALLREIHRGVVQRIKLGFLE